MGVNCNCIRLDCERELTSLKLPFAKSTNTATIKQLKMEEDFTEFLASFLITSEPIKV